MTHHNDQRRKLQLLFAEHDLEQAKEFNGWLGQVGSVEAARIFAQRGDSPPHIVDLRPLRQRIAKLKGKL
jgi:hypothetical protein